MKTKQQRIIIATLLLSAIMFLSYQIAEYNKAKAEYQQIEYLPL